MARRRKAQQAAEAASADARWKAMVAKMPRNMQDSAASSLPGSLRAQFGDGAAPLPSPACPYKPSIVAARMQRLALQDDWV